MKKLPPALVYSVLRLLFFIVPLAVMLLFPVMRQYWWLTAIFAMLIGLSLSIIFLRRPLAEVSGSLAERRERRRREHSDEEAEDLDLSE